MRFFETTEQREKSKKLVEAAQRAVVTRKARRAFKERYPDTWDLAQMVLEGRVDDLNVEVSRSVAAAVKANLSRPGTYRDMALACNYKPSNK